MAKKPSAIVIGFLKEREKRKTPEQDFSSGLLREREDETNRRMDEMLKTMNDTIEYLRLAPQEQAKREAEPFLKEATEKQAALENEIAELRHKPDPPRSPPEETGKLRKLLRDADEFSGALKKTVVQHEREITLLKEAGEKASSEHQKSLEAARNQAPKVLTQGPVKPENIDFVYHREVNGLLSRVILKAEGYTDVEVGIVRGTDNRMKHLKIGEAQ